MLKKKPIKMILIIFACLFLFALLFVLLITRPGNDIYEKNKRIQNFGVLTYETLRHEPSEEDYEASETILTKVDDALSYVGTKEDSPISPPLDSLCRYTDDFDYVTVDYSISFITFKKILNRGYLWFEYSAVRYDENGEIETGSWENLCLVKLKQEHGKWIPIDYMQTA